MERAPIRDFEGLLTTEDARRLGLLESDRYRISCQIRFACACSKADRDRYWQVVEGRDGKAYMESLRQLTLDHWNKKHGKPKRACTGSIITPSVST